MSKKTLLEMLNEMRGNDTIIEKKDKYTFTKISGDIVNIKMGNKSKKLDKSDSKEFLKNLEVYTKKFKNKTQIDDFMGLYGYDELLESDDYKYNSMLKDNKDKTMSKPSKKDAKSKMDAKAETDETLDNEEEMDEATRYQRELKEKDNPFEKSKDKDDDDSDSDDDDADKKDDKDSDEDDKADDGKLTTDDDDEEEKDDSEKDDKKDKDDDDEEMEESVSMDTIIQSEVDAVTINSDEIFESLEGEELTEEDKVLYTKMAKLMEVKLKEGLTTAANKMVDLLEDANVTIQEGLVAKMDAFTLKVVKEWKAENHVAIQENARTKMNEAFVAKILGVVTESQVNVSEDDLDKINSLNETISERDETIAKISDEILESAKVQEDLQKQLVRREFVIEDKDQTDIFEKLIEDVEYVNEEDYRNKLNVLHKKYITEAKTEEVVIEDNDAEVKSLLEDMAMFEDIDIDVEQLNETTDVPVVSHPSGRVNTLLESLKGGKST